MGYRVCFGSEGTGKAPVKLTMMEMLSHGEVFPSQVGNYSGKTWIASDWVMVVSFQGPSPAPGILAKAFLPYL